QGPRGSSEEGANPPCSAGEDGDETVNAARPWPVNDIWWHHSTQCNAACYRTRRGCDSFVGQTFLSARQARMPAPRHTECAYYFLRSTRQPAAIDRHDTAVHVLGGLGGQEDDEAAQFFRPAPALLGDAVENLRAAHRVVLEN